MSQDWHNNPDQVGRRMFPSQCKWHFLWLFVYLLYHHYFLCTITDWLSLYFFFYNKPHCWKENVSQGQHFSGRNIPKTYEWNGIWFENCSNLLWDKNCSSDRKNIFQIIYLEPRIFEKFFLIPKTIFSNSDERPASQHSFWNRIPLFKVIQVEYIGIIKVPIATNNWDVKTYRKNVLLEILFALQKPKIFCSPLIFKKLMCTHFHP